MQEKYVSRWHQNLDFVVRNEKFTLSMRYIEQLSHDDSKLLSLIPYDIFPVLNWRATNWFGAPFLLFLQWYQEAQIQVCSGHFQTRFLHLLSSYLSQLLKKKCQEKAFMTLLHSWLYQLLMLLILARNRSPVQSRYVYPHFRISMSPLCQSYAVSTNYYILKESEIV